MKKGNFFLGGIIIAISAYVIVVASGYPKAASYGTGVPGPGLWPIVVAAIMGFCGLLLILKTALKEKTDSRKSETEKSSEEKVNLWSPETRRVYITMGILLVYCIILRPLGFIIPTIFMMGVFVQWFYRKQIWRTVIISVVSTMVVYFIFKLVLNVPMDFGLFYL